MGERLRYEGMEIVILIIAWLAGAWLMDWTYRQQWRGMRPERRSKKYQKPFKKVLEIVKNWAK